MTEFGFETNPPDPFSGVPLAAQAQFNTIGEYQAWQNPRIVSQAQFLLRDVPPVKKHPKTSKAYWFTYQSGLYGVTGQPKPAATAYATPFLAFNTGALEPTTGAPIYNLWGQLRFAAQRRARPAYDAVAREGRLDAVGHDRRHRLVDTMGYFQATRSGLLPVPGEWRAAVITRAPARSSRRAFPAAEHPPTRVPVGARRWTAAARPRLDAGHGFPRPARGSWRARRPIRATSCRA